VCASCIVIVELDPQAAGGAESAQHQVIGVVVDAVNEVLDIAPADIEPAPAFGVHIGREFIQGMGKVKGRFVILLNVNHALSLADLGALTALPSEARADPIAA
jgi:purine-binding chemotaxis protein CheW